jgi:hypothetical protein
MCGDNFPNLSYDEGISEERVEPQHGGVQLCGLISVFILASDFSKLFPSPDHLDPARCCQVLRVLHGDWVNLRE